MSANPASGWGVAAILATALIRPWRLYERTAESLRWRGFLALLVVLYIIGAGIGLASAAYSRFHPQAVEPALLLPLAFFCEAAARAMLVTAIHSPLARLPLLALFRFYWLTAALTNTGLVIALAGYDLIRQASGQVVMPSVVLDQILGVMVLVSWLVWTAIDLVNFRARLAPLGAHVATGLLFAGVLLALSG